MSTSNCGFRLFLSPTAGGVYSVLNFRREMTMFSTEAMSLLEIPDLRKSDGSFLTCRSHISVP